MDYPKTVKRYNLELNSKEKRGSKLCPNNYTKTSPMPRLNHFLKNTQKKKSNLATSCKFLESKEVGSLNYFLNNEKIRITFPSSTTEEQLIER